MDSKSEHSEDNQCGNEDLLLAINRAKSDIVKALRKVELRSYKQLEALVSLNRVLSISGALPPLRGWAASPDVLLMLHQYVTNARPELVVEFGSGASTLVIADALRQNGSGKLISVESSRHYSEKTKSMLKGEGVDIYVDIEVSELGEWGYQHLLKDEVPYWYSHNVLADCGNVDLVFVDGPPASLCKYARFPALEVVYEKLSNGAEVWLDDLIREDEKEICEAWSSRFDMALEIIDLEKGLGRLRRK